MLSAYADEAARLTLDPGYAVERILALTRWALDGYARVAARCGRSPSTSRCCGAGATCGC